MPTKDLAKALHTLTTVPNVATYLATKGKYASGAELTRAALMIVNPVYDYTAAELVRIQKSRSVEWFARIVDACDEILGK